MEKSVTNAGGKKKGNDEAQVWIPQDTNPFGHLRRRQTHHASGMEGDRQRT